RFVYLLPTWCYFLWNLTSQSPGVHDQGEASGTRRDSLYYSVLVDEWPSVRDKLVARVAAKAAV
ncbi:hypothetical protein ABT298_39095, partial [Streptomyces sp. NPDC001034]